MNTKNFTDLRYIISMFFRITAAILLVSGSLPAEKPYGQTLNLCAGAGMLLFAEFMAWLSRRK